MKGTTLSLGGFLGDDSSKVVYRTSAEDGDGGEVEVLDRAALPSAPRAALEKELNRERAPREPPFRAYIGNLAYEIVEEVCAYVYVFFSFALNVCRFSGCICNSY